MTPKTSIFLWKQDPEAYETLRTGLSELELRFARPRELDDPKVGSLFVLSGVVLVQTIRAAEESSVTPSVAPVAATESRRRDRALYRPPDGPRPGTARE